MSSNRTDAEKLRAILDSTAESIRESRDQDVLEEARLQGLDPGSEAARIRGLMLRTVRSHQQRALRSARQAYEAQISGGSVQASITSPPSRTPKE
jgi:DNA-directed RNA polymerase specialized sigma24 family protein